MRKLFTILLGLTMALGTVSLSLAGGADPQDPPKAGATANEGQKKRRSGKKRKKNRKGKRNKNKGAEQAPAAATPQP